MQISPEIHRGFPVTTGNPGKAYGTSIRSIIVMIIVLFFPSSVSSSSTGRMKIEYDVTITGIEQRDLRTQLESASDTFAMRQQPPATTALLRAMVEGDVSNFQRVLNSAGYYNALISHIVDTNVSPVMITFRIDKGTLYTIQNVDIRIKPGHPAVSPDASEISLNIGMPARSVAIIEADNKILEWFLDRGYPFPELLDRKVVVDHSVQGMMVTYEVDPGSKAGLGKVIVRGLKTIDEKLVLKAVPWKHGRDFDPVLLEELRNRLTRTGYFSLVTIRTAESLDDDGSVPIIIELEERRHRTISLGVGYRTDEGFGISPSWENRNFRGAGERLSVSARASDIALVGKAEYLKPYFFHPNQHFVADVTLADERPDAYTSNSISLTTMVKRQIRRGMSVGGGVGLKHSRVKQSGKKETYDLLYLPVSLDFDSSDDVFIPSSGGRFSAWVAPYRDIGDRDLNFFKSRIVMTRYVRVTENPDVVLAGRIAVGSIAGASRDEIPADERFYAGGGNSIRGYPYQTVSPLDGTTPIGGRSLFEMSGEIRIGITEKLGIVPFLDAGNAFEDTLPDVSQDLLFGAGVGVRYNTPIGPLRFDIAVPIDKRDGIDDSFQVYLSLGSSF